MLKQALAKNGLIAILRGLRPQEAAAIGEVLYQAGFRVIEVPLNFAALAEGADVLKMFPAEQMGPAVVKAWLAVLPAGTLLIPVGGITPDNMRPFVEAGVSGFGLGSGLFKPGLSADETARRAKAYVQAWNALR